MYQIIDGVFRLEDAGEYRAYGVQSPEGLRIDDIALDRDRVAHFVETLNRCDVSALHLMDFVLDFIG